MGDLELQPNSTVDVQEFSRQYHANKKYCDEAFAFLKNNDLTKLAPGKYTIDVENVYASVTEAPTKNYDKSKWESHRKYIDLQYVISGEEKIGVAPVANLKVIVPYKHVQMFFKLKQIFSKQYRNRVGSSNCDSFKKQLTC